MELSPYSLIHSEIDPVLKDGGWLCFGNRCVSLDVLKKVNMVQGQQDGPLRLH